MVHLQFAIPITVMSTALSHMPWDRDSAVVFAQHGLCHINGGSDHHPCCLCAMFFLSPLLPVSATGVRVCVCVHSLTDEKQHISSLLFQRMLGSNAPLESGVSTSR